MKLHVIMHTYDLGPYLKAASDNVDTLLGYYSSMIVVFLGLRDCLEVQGDF